MTGRRAAAFAVAAVLAAVAAVAFAVHAPPAHGPARAPVTSGAPWSPSQTYAPPR